NGAPGYINFLDALNSWQLVRELDKATSLPAAASFKHVSPAGAAVGLELDPSTRQACLIDGDAMVSPTAAAYVRARGADRMSSYGDWAAVSREVDVSLAKCLMAESSDGIIAPGYGAEALAMLRTKAKGAYRIVKVDPGYEPPPMETREVFGIRFEQMRNACPIGPELLGNVVTRSKAIPEGARLDLTIAMLTLKYTQSNSVCYAYGGQVTGVGAGQQSRVHCARLAGDKSDKWFLRRHPDVLGLRFRQGVKRVQKENAIDAYLMGDEGYLSTEAFTSLFEEVPETPTKEAKEEWLRGVTGVSLASDAYFPFDDSIERARLSGVKYIAQPGGSVRDDEVVRACDRYGIAMAMTGLRLFHH
ncbi:MAG: phosphoribosylaminoimidazolecarboxamide formyltransferase, partial [Oscillospiraceae bacterium]|nr:phosphoribosylaminoimidazolecarboxamide formyltransferase [Oscillospiraceae bacterium]